MERDKIILDLLKFFEKGLRMELATTEGLDYDKYEELGMEKIEVLNTVDLMRRDGLITSPRGKRIISKPSVKPTGVKLNGAKITGAGIRKLKELKKRYS